jgi:hypothetical protein
MVYLPLLIQGILLQVRELIAHLGDSGSIDSSENYFKSNIFPGDLSNEWLFQWDLIMHCILIQTEWERSLPAGGSTPKAGSHSYACVIF